MIEGLCICAWMGERRRAHHTRLFMRRGGEQMRKENELEVSGGGVKS